MNGITNEIKIAEKNTTAAEIQPKSVVVFNNKTNIEINYAKTSFHCSTFTIVVLVLFYLQS